MAKATAKRAEKHTKPFTDLLIRDKLPYAAKGEQYTVWDKGQPGLFLLVGAKTKTFRSQFKLNGAWLTRTLGRYSDTTLAKARDLADSDRKSAAKGIDPREGGQAQQQKTDKLTYEYVVDQFIELYAKPRQRTWDQTERILKNSCKLWLKRQFKDISKTDAYNLLEGFISAGHSRKATVTESWLKTLWAWAYKRGYAPSPVMDMVELETEKRNSERFYTDDEVKACWAAANKLEAEEATFVKLIMLLSPRKTSLACAIRKDLDKGDAPTLWTVPFELTKSRKKSSKKRVYFVPLPPLAQRLFKGVMKAEVQPSDRLFPSLLVYKTKAGSNSFDGKKLKLRLVEHGAPQDFTYHAWRHTIATFLENAGHSEWERGLVLNHSGSGSVTADYSHGYPLELKTTLLTKWADHVEGLVQPTGAALLR